MKKKKIIKKKTFSKEIKALVNFLWECRILKYIPRASLQYLKGPTKENIAEHSFYVAVIAWLLANLKKAQEEKVIKMALIHNLPAGRGGERNLINRFYTQEINKQKIIQEISDDYYLKDLKFVQLFQELAEGKTLESKIVRDADILAEMLLEKECFDLGNKQVNKWLLFSLNRLKTKEGKILGELLIKTDVDTWWLELVKRYILITEYF